MSLGLRLPVLLLLLAGCAAQRLEVPDSDWETVPAAARAAVDRQVAADLAAAQAELKAATTGLAELQRSTVKPAVAPAPAPQPPTATKPADDDEWASTEQFHERARRDAFVRVEAAKAEWQRADLSWRELRLAAAKERVDMVVCQRELVRAQTIDHNLPGTDTYNVAPLRGQFSQVQQRWYLAANSARQARSVLEHDSATLASAKEAYAQLIRNVPLSVALPSIASDERPTLQLPGWVVTRSDIRRRRGLRHFLDETAGAPPQLRKAVVRLTVRSVPAAPAATAPLADVQRSPPTTITTVTTAGMHPADAAAADLPSGPASAGGARPADRPAAPGTGKPASATAQVNPASPAPASDKPAPGGAQASRQPSPRAPQASPPSARSTVPSAAVVPASPASPANPRPAAAPTAGPSMTATAKPSPPGNAVSAGDKPAPGVAKPTVTTPRGNQPAAASVPAAKPVD